MEMVSPPFRRFLGDICIVCKLGLMLLLTIFVRRIPEEKKIKCAQLLRRIFEVLFTHYRLSRMTLFHILNFIECRLTISIRRVREYTQKCHSECEEDTSRWSNELPEDIMQNVLQRLCLSDFFRCRAVCVSWQANVDMAIASKSFRPIPELPWLMLCSHPFSTKDNSFLSLTDDQKLICKSAPTYTMKRGDCVGSIDGWLIVADSVLWRPEGFMKPWSFYLYNHQSSTFSINFFFLNPLSGARVMLPSSKSTLPCHCSNGPGFCIVKVAASSVPTSQDCYVVSLCISGHLAFSRPNDNSWTLIDQGEARGFIFCDIEIIYGKIYAATTEASKFLMVFDVQYGNGPPSYRAERLVMLEPSPVPSMFLDIRRTDGVESHSNCELISLAKNSLSEELFMIFCSTTFILEEDQSPWHVIFGSDFILPPQIQAFRVFKMEWKINGPQWIEVLDLGDQILFVSVGGNKMISTSNFLNHNGLNDKAFQRNCIYFAYHSSCLALPSKGRSFGVFSLTNRSIKCVTFPEEHSFTQLYSRPVWFTPNPW
ncbi:hypothetical protein ABKV19_003391 [Rosa sericea]